MLDVVEKLFCIKHECFVLPLEVQLAQVGFHRIPLVNPSASQLP